MFRCNEGSGSSLLKWNQINRCIYFLYSDGFVYKLSKAELETAIIFYYIAGKGSESFIFEQVEDFENMGYAFSQYCIHRRADSNKMNAGEILNSTYEIKEQIGSGGGGTIYKAYHKRLQKDVVLKKIHQSDTRNEDEKEILKNLKHSCLPQVYDFLDVEDGVYTIIDYIPGQSFEKLLKEKKKFSQKKVVKYALQLCEVVDYLHKQTPPIIHGDIKPANIMLTPDDNICLIDFNISGVLDGKSMETMGYTPGYASPEQAASFQMIQTSYEALSKTDLEKTELIANDEKTELLCDDEKTELLQDDNSGQLFRTDSKMHQEQYTYQVDVRSDVYSIGATLYHFLTGVKPSGDPDKITKPSELDPSIGESISVILMKALSKDPKQRFQTTESMLRAFRKIHKFDFRYKRMVLQQELVFLAAVLCVGAGILLTFFGKQELEVEKEEEYVQAVDMLSDAVADRANEQKIEEMYNMATAMKPERLEAYFQKALYYYETREYEKDIEYIQEMILPKPEFFEQKLIADVYFILGNCCFELEQYENAITYYRTAIDMDDQRLEFYRDYVIALVRNGNLPKAEETLAKAEGEGISSIDLLLVKGELKKAKGDYAGAEQDLRQCINEAQDDNIRMRAYIICDMVYREQSADFRNTENDDSSLEYLVKSQKLMEEARTKVGLENRLLIYECLAQTYIDLQELTSQDSYGQSAVSILQDVVSQGWGTYLTYNNIAILYQKMGQFDEAQDTLDQMLELDAENYNTYKRMAFLEAEKQNQKENTDRQYADFVQYYEKAKELFEAAPSGGQDVEMQLLDKLYQQLEEGGWFK